MADGCRDIALGDLGSLKKFHGHHKLVRATGKLTLLSPLLRLTKMIFERLLQTLIFLGQTFHLKICVKTYKDPFRSDGARDDEMLLEICLEAAAMTFQVSQLLLLNNRNDCFQPTERFSGLLFLARLLCSSRRPWCCWRSLRSRKVSLFKEL